MPIPLTYSFVAHTRAKAAEVQGNFDTLATRALDKTGDTMTGNLLFTDATYDIGASGATRPRDFFLSRNALIGGTLGVTGVTTLSGGAALVDQLITRPVIKDYGETKVAATISSGTLTLDCELGNVFVATLNANVTTFTVTNWPATGTKGSVELWLVADGTPRTFALGSYKSPGGATYTPSSTNGKYDVVTIHSFDAGTNVFFLVAGQNL